MYKINSFTEEDNEKVIAFMQQNSFAIITSLGEKFPVATHVPLGIIASSAADSQLTTGNSLFFTGHIMKNTDHHKAFLKNENVLVIFNGPHCHVSASWYPIPNVASTWNYITVHAKGKVRFGDEAFTKKIVEDLTNKYENENSPAAYNKLPAEYIDRLAKAIIGFTIEVEELENVFKLSQNHDVETRKSIIDHLYKNGSDDEKKIAGEMQLRIDIPKQNK